MKKQACPIPASILILLVFVSLGCEATAQIFPTATLTATVTSTATLTPTVTPTRTATITPTPLPDISRASLTLADLPADFKVVDGRDLGYPDAGLGEDVSRPHNVFSFVNYRSFQIIIGSSLLLTKKVDRVSIDLILSEPETTLKSFVENSKDETVRDAKLMDGLEDIGDRQIGMSMLTKMNDVPVRMEILIFRRGSIEAHIMSIVLEGHKSNISLHDLGIALDHKILQTLGTAN